MSVNDKQIGGDHYRAPIQHWDFIEVNGIGYLEGCASKYATRNRKKHEDPVEDLEKAIHYCEKLQSLHLAGRRNNRRGPLVINPEEFAAANNLNDAETRVVMILTFWEDAGDLQDAIETIQDMLKAATSEGDDSEEHC